MNSPAALLAAMRATGIGFAGLAGAWWRPAAAPFPFSAAAQAELRALGPALFALFDVVAARYGADPTLTALLTYKTPPALRPFVGPGQVGAVRPDFQVCPTEAGERFVATELEMCPSSHGWAHAMQVGYGLGPGLAAQVARFLGGRALWIVGTEQWSEFLIEQLAFCRALAEHGARAWVTYDRPLAVMAAEFAAGRRWQPPMFGVPARPAVWDTDLLGRLRADGLMPFWREPLTLPADPAEVVLFRFGYLENFTQEMRAQFQAWAAAGVAALNPPAFYLDAKAVLAALALPGVRADLGAAALAVLERAVPETLLLQPEHLPRLRAEREQWVLKFSGYDTGQAAWGGRSLQLGPAHTAASWEAALQQYLALPFPAVAQRLTPTAQIALPYFDRQGQPQVLADGFVRLRSFFLRGDPEPAGSHLTASGGTMQVSEGTDAVQAPVIFT